MRTSTRADVATGATPRVLGWRVLMDRRRFSREFKLEAVKQVRERGAAVAQAARDLDLHMNVSRKWVRNRAARASSARCRGSAA